MSNRHRFTAPVHLASKVYWPGMIPTNPGETIVLVPDPDGGYLGYPLDEYHKYRPYGQPVAGVYLWQEPNDGRYRVFFLHLDNVLIEANRLKTVSANEVIGQTSPTDDGDGSDATV